MRKHNPFVLFTEFNPNTNQDTVKVGKVIASNSKDDKFVIRVDRTMAESNMPSYVVKLKDDLYYKIY